MFRWRMPGALAGELAAAVGAMCVLADAPGMLEPAPELLGHARPGARRELFAACLGDLATKLTGNRADEIVAEAIRRAQGRQPLGIQGDAASAWDEYALALARDHMFGLNKMKDRMWALCVEVLDGLSAFERSLLLRTTEEYRAHWDGDAPEPDDDEARRWLAGELTRRLSDQAIDHGYDLQEADEDDS